ncbi:hypothetical protein Pan181_51560 [Aeoliella mucimassa]|uniref:PEP-CTERM protein-sorting domain-containing protein n=1 Tax=Aeoliella mucimassa TaxID=2527972 RepID=A0A518AVZ8_9BACT|nr:hypothetical protein Pan181_51560 [Aeoliella mucimassa]
MRFLSLYATVLLAVGGWPSPAHAAVIYSQTTPEEPWASYTSSNLQDRQKIADNFLVEGTGQYTVRSIRFIGGYDATGIPPSPMPDDDFKIVILNDNAGSPTTPTASGTFSVNSASTWQPTNGQLLNGIGAPIEFVLNLGDGVKLNRGTTYWLSILNNPRPGSGWAWARANGLIDQDLAATNDDVATGPWNVGTSGGMWFELSTTAIPEPSGIALFSFGGALLAAITWRQTRVHNARNHPCGF